MLKLHLQWVVRLVTYLKLCLICLTTILFHVLVLGPEMERDWKVHYRWGFSWCGALLPKLCWNFKLLQNSTEGNIDFSETQSIRWNDDTCAALFSVYVCVCVYIRYRKTPPVFFAWGKSKQTRCRIDMLWSVFCKFGAGVHNFLPFTTKN